MNNIKRKCSRFLVAVIIVSMCLVPFNGYSVFAADTVTRAEWLSQLVSTFDMTVEDDNYPDNYFNDLDSSSEYYYDMLVAVQFGLVNVEAGDNMYPEDSVTREFAADTLNLCLGFQLDENAEYTFSDIDDVLNDDNAQIAINRKWFALIDGKFSPETAITTSEKNKMIEDAEVIWASTNIDSNYNNTYEFADDVKEIPSDNEVYLLDDGRIYIANSSIEVKNGDKIAVFLNDLPCVYLVSDIEKAGDDLIISGTEVDHDDAYDELDMQGTLDASALQLGDSPEGLDVDYSEEVETPKVNTMALRSSLLKAKGTINLNKKTKLSVSGKVTVGDGQEVSVKMSVKNAKIDYKVSLTGETFVKLSGDSDLSCSAEFDTMKAIGMDEITLVPATIPGVGGFDVVLELSAGGKISCKSSGHFATGVSYSKANGFRLIKEFKAKEFSVNAEVSGSAGLCMRFGLTGKLMPLKGYVYAKAGGEISLKIADYAEGTPDECVTFAAWVYMSVGAKVKFKLGFVDMSFEDKYEVFDEKNSPIRIYHHYEDGKEVLKCTRGIEFEQATGHKQYKYTTRTTSKYWNSGWLGGANDGGSYGFDDNGNQKVVFEYSLDNENNATITKYNGCASYLAIPEYIDGHKVVGIGYEAFKCNVFLESVTFPDSVISIAFGAFYECTNLSQVDLPENLTKLSGYAFYNCDKIETITIPKTLESNGYYSMSQGPFGSCDGLKTVKFAKGITSIDSDLFYYCTGLEEIEIPNTVTVIKEYAFANCENLKKVVIPDSVESIRHGAFRYCKSLQEVALPDNVTNMGSYVFENCYALNKVHIPNIRVNLPDGTFFGCTSLTEVNLPDTLETIGQSAFYNCTSLKEVNLPEKVNTINSSTFYGCTALEKVTIPSSVKTIYDSAFSHCEALTDLTISEGVTTIYSNAFEYNKSLEKVTLPDSLQTLGEYAFRYCDMLNEAHFGAGIKTVPKYCFYEDPELVSVVLPQQVTKVDEFAFGNCTKFTDITMNRNVSSASLNAFSYPAKLTIHGVLGTYAETFANDNSIKFDALSAKTTAIKLNKTELELGRGYTERLTAAITPEDSADEFTWTSTDEDIVTVDADGMIKAISGGEASVIAMSGDIMEICEVTVYEPVSSVYLDKSSYTGTTGDTLQLTATIYPSDATYKDIIWSSDNNNVASVDSNGLVTLGKYGTANVTVTTKDMSRTATCTITVKGIDVTGVSLSEKKTTIQVGQQKTLEAIIAPENATNKNVTWTSTKTEVATVNNGVVTGVSTGTAIIMVKTEDGAKTASCTVTVEEAADVVSQNADVVFDSEVDDDGTKTVDPVSFNIYNNTDEAITGVEATLDKGEAFSVELPDTIAANDSIVITIIPNEDLSVGVYEDVVTIVAGENTLNIPIKLEIKAKNNSSGENKSDEGDKENEQGKDEDNGGTSQEIKDKTDNGTGNNPATDTQQTPAGTNNQKTSQPGNTSAQTTIPSVTPTPAVSDQLVQPTTVVKVSKPSKVTLSLAKNTTKKTIKVSWKKLAANGYQVQMALNKKFTKSKKAYSTTKTSLSVKKLKKGKTYYVRVRAFNKDGSKKLYGSWSKTKKVKIKK